MYSIGEFSKIVRLSIKTIRFYHERNLIVPTYIDPDSGYRFYNDKLVERARIIVVLRALQFSLEQVAEILADCSEDADLVELLKEQRARIQAEIKSRREVSAELEKVIRAEETSWEIISKMTDSIELKTVDRMLIAGIRMKGRYSDCGKGFAQLGKSAGWNIAGKAMCLFYDEGYREDDADFEVCFPVKKTLKKEGIDCRELPECQCLSMIHRGPYDRVGPTYQKLIDYAKENGLEIAGPCREVYIKGPGMIFKGNPDKYVTEVQFPIAE